MITLPHWSPLTAQYEQPAAASTHDQRCHNLSPTSTNARRRITRKRSTPNQRVPSSSLGRCTPSDLGVLVIKRAAAVSWSPESGRTAASVVDDQQVAARSQRRIPSTPLLLADPIIAASHAVMFSLIVNPSPSKTSAAFGWSPGPPRVHRVVSQLLSTGHGPRWNAQEQRTHPRCLRTGRQPALEARYLAYDWDGGHTAAVNRKFIATVIAPRILSDEPFPADRPVLAGEVNCQAQASRAGCGDRSG